MTCECGNELSVRTTFRVNGVTLCGVCRNAVGAVPVHGGTPASFGASEHAVVWENPATGEVRYPGRNDAPIPALYAGQGFQRKEFTSLRELQSFENRKGVRNESIWFDKGSGRGFI